MNWQNALWHGFLWSWLWGIPIGMMVRVWPQLWLHVYPKTIQEVTTLPPLAGKRRFVAYAFIILWFALLLASLCWSVATTYAAGRVSYWVVFLHTLVMMLVWDVFNLLVLDWLVFCTLRPAWIVLPGSEGHPGYRDYRYHWRGFLKGCVVSILGALVLSVLGYAVMGWLAW